MHSSKMKLLELKSSFWVLGLEGSSQSLPGWPCPPPNYATSGSRAPLSVGLVLRLKFLRREWRTTQGKKLSSMPPNGFVFVVSPHVLFYSVCTHTVVGPFFFPPRNRKWDV